MYQIKVTNKNGRITKLTRIFDDVLAAMLVNECKKYRLKSEDVEFVNDQLVAEVCYGLC